MKKNVFKLFCLLFLAVLPLMSQSAKAQVPANCPDVMLQAFDYYPEPISINGAKLGWNDSKWTTLNSQAAEIGASFNMIWLPPSGNAGPTQTMGYLPIYWFDQNSSFGNQADLKTLITNLKNNNCKAIADIVVNHRAGVSNWVNFPTESYGGATFTPNMSWICNDDECKNNGYNPTGNSDEGEQYGAARDLDHKNTDVQTAIKAYLTFLKNDIGYSGWRYDVAKGYAPFHMGDYNDAAAGYFSVGEVMETSYDIVKNWINNTGKRSAAFDFPAQQGMREAFGSNDLTKLVSSGQPSGLIAADLKRYSVTFVENHDTYRYNLGFSGNIEAANAFMLASPGVPCVYFPHWKAFKTNIQKMIAARKSAGVHSESVITILNSASNLYVAKAIGTKGELIVKIGSGSYSAPAGFNLACSGTDWAMYTSGSTPTGPSLTVAPLGGLYNGGTSVTLSSSGGVAPVKIYYTLDNTTPTNKSLLYSAPISITVNKTVLQAIAIDNGGAASDVAINTYLTEKPAGITVKFKAPTDWASVSCYVWTTATPAVNLAGAWPGTDVTKDANGYYAYTISNATSFPVNVIFNNKNNNKQTIDLSTSTNICWDPSTSSVVGATTKFTVTEAANCGGVPAPTVSISPAGGNYIGGTSVTLTSSEGANPVKIYYTINGTTPSVNSPLYTAPIPVTVDGTVVKAIAIDALGQSSPIPSEQYFTSAPTGITVRFLPPANWTNVSVWAWMGTGTPNLTGGTWPGQSLTKDASGYVEFTTSTQNSGFNIIFNNGGNNEQTVDILNITANSCYTTTGTGVGAGTAANAKKYDYAQGGGCFTDIETISAKPSIVIYPNPARETFTIESNLNLTSVKIYSINGNMVKSMTVNSSSETISITELVPGFYTVVATADNDTRTTSKLIKQ